MKASKLIVLAGGILGILAFFLPLVAVHHQGDTVKVSAFQAVKGIDAVAGAADEVASTHHMRAAAQDDDALGKIKGMIFAFFAPALLLAVIGGLGVARKKFGRGAGVLSLLVGLIGLGVGALLNSAAEGDGGIAITMLIITGLAGTVGGILAIAKPDRGAAPVGVAPMARLAA